MPEDARILARIRAMGQEDVPAVSDLHRAAMGRSLWARLGPAFLRALYSELLHQPPFLAFVYVQDGRVLGFIAGATDSKGLFSRTLLGGWSRLLGPLLRGLLASPSTIVPLLATPLYFARSHPGDEIPAESLFCSFVPELRGTRVSGEINRVFFRRLLAQGHQRVKITTEVDNQGANRQLMSWGFRARGRFRFYGKTMVTYVLDLPGHPRLSSPDGPSPGTRQGQKKPG
ncbi:MAG: hypothetical protein ACOX9B_08085 [Candidatus Xenobium sp.]|jgi:hypothetical protein